jgi:hypothetical protein
LSAASMSILASYRRDEAERIGARAEIKIKFRDEFFLNW